MKGKRAKRGGIAFLLLAMCICVSACGKTAFPAAESPPETPEVTPLTTPEPVILRTEKGEEMPLPEDTEEVELKGNAFIPSLVENSYRLPKLKMIRLEDGSDFSHRDVTALQEAFPEADIEYRILLSGQEIPADTQTIELTDLTDAADTAVELGKLAHLRLITIGREAPDITDQAMFRESFSRPVTASELSLHDVGLLQDKLPDVVIDCPFLLFGQMLSTADERVEYVRERHIGDQGLELFRQVLPYMNRLTYLKLDDCGTTSTAMAALRDEYPEIKVVWRVWFGNYGLCGDGTYAMYNCLTDTEKIWATGTLRDRNTEDLKYCTDVRYIDIGHNSITNIDFVNYMPKIEVAVFSITYIDDISPLANCPNLEFLELFRTYVTDLSPLENCSKLRHLYVYDEARAGIRDISPVMGLELDRFYCTLAESAADQKEEFVRKHPDCECDFSWVFIGLNNWRLRNGDYVERYRLLREQFGYDSFEMSK